LRYPGLDKRAAIVSGANHGIGAATARLLAANGARVLISYFRTPAHDVDAQGVVDAITVDDGYAMAIEADLRDPETPRRLFDAAESAFGPVEILVNNATGGGRDTFKPSTNDRLGRTLASLTANSASLPLDVDARGSALLIAELARRHVARNASWGRIIGLTSGGPMGFPEEVSYGAGKAALQNYAMSAALELADYGITSNVVYPPITDTGWVTEEVREFVKHSREHFRVAQPEEVAEVIAYLASDLARLVTGNVIVLR
jgi:3-oxoacyl-[acyl-carrier protein] reductase